ncbi:hypothetical protein [Streptomyces sp. KL116D]
MFVPRRGARDEDDGYVLSYVNDPRPRGDRLDDLPGPGLRRPPAGP